MSNRDHPHSYGSQNSYATPVDPRLNHPGGPRTPPGPGPITPLHRASTSAQPAAPITPPLVAQPQAHYVYESYQQYVDPRLGYNQHYSMYPFPQAASSIPSTSNNPYLTLGAKGERPMEHYQPPPPPPPPPQRRSTLVHTSSVPTAQPPPSTIALDATVPPPPPPRVSEQRTSPNGIPPPPAPPVIIPRSIDDRRSSSYVHTNGSNSGSFDSELLAGAHQLSVKGDYKRKDSGRKEVHVPTSKGMPHDVHRSERSYEGLLLPPQPPTSMPSSSSNNQYELVPPPQPPKLLPKPRCPSPPKVQDASFCAHVFPSPKTPVTAKTPGSNGKTPKTPTHTHRSPTSTIANSSISSAGVRSFADEEEKTEKFLQEERRKEQEQQFKEAKKAKLLAENAQKQRVQEDHERRRQQREEEKAKQEKQDREHEEQKLLSETNGQLPTKDPTPPAKKAVLVEPKPPKEAPVLQKVVKALPTEFCGVFRNDTPKPLPPGLPRSTSVSTAASSTAKPVPSSISQNVESQKPATPPIFYSPKLQMKAVAGTSSPSYVSSSVPSTSTHPLKQDSVESPKTVKSLPLPNGSNGVLFKPDKQSMPLPNGDSTHHLNGSVEVKTSLPTESVPESSSIVSTGEVESLPTVEKTVVRSLSEAHEDHTVRAAVAAPKINILAKPGVKGPSTATNSLPELALRKLRLKERKNKISQMSGTIDLQDHEPATHKNTETVEQDAEIDKMEVDSADATVSMEVSETTNNSLSNCVMLPEKSIKINGAVSVGVPNMPEPHIMSKLIKTSEPIETPPTGSVPKESMEMSIQAKSPSSKMDDVIESVASMRSTPVEVRASSSVSMVANTPDVSAEKTPSLFDYVNHTDKIAMKTTLSEKPEYVLPRPEKPIEDVLLTPYLVNGNNSRAESGKQKPLSSEKRKKEEKKETRREASPVANLVLNKDEPSSSNTLFASPTLSSKKQRKEGKKKAVPDSPVQIPDKKLDETASSTSTLKSSHKKRQLEEKGKKKEDEKNRKKRAVTVDVRNSDPPTATITSSSTPDPPSYFVIRKPIVTKAALKKLPSPPRQPAKRGRKRKVVQEPVRKSPSPSPNVVATNTVTHTQAELSNDVSLHRRSGSAATLDYLREPDAQYNADGMPVQVSKFLTNLLDLETKVTAAKIAEKTNKTDTKPYQFKRLRLSEPTDQDKNNTNAHNDQSTPSSKVAALGSLSGKFVTTSQPTTPTSTSEPSHSPVGGPPPSPAPAALLPIHVPKTEPEEVPPVRMYKSRIQQTPRPVISEYEELITGAPGKVQYSRLSSYSRSRDSTVIANNPNQVIKALDLIRIGNDLETILTEETSLAGLMYPKKEEDEPVVMQRQFSTNRGELDASSNLSNAIHALQSNSYSGALKRAELLNEIVARQAVIGGNENVTVRNVGKTIDKENAGKGVRRGHPDFERSKAAAEYAERNGTSQSRATYRNLIQLTREFNVPQLSGKYLKFLNVYKHPNGGAMVMSCDYNELKRCMSKMEMYQFFRLFIRLGFAERKTGAVFSICIVENGAEEMVDVFAEIVKIHPHLQVKTTDMVTGNLVTTMPIRDYYEEVMDSLDMGTFRRGGLNAVTMVGVKAEEAGGVYPEVLSDFDKHPFLSTITPWGEFSQLHGLPPNKSDDGPIFWVRPGEQCVPMDYMKTSGKKEREEREASRVPVIHGTRNAEKREHVCIDRTPSHADQVASADEPHGRKPTAAVGILQAVKERGPNNKPLKPYYADERSIVKDVVVFEAADYATIAAILLLDVYEPPATQCHVWVEDTKLNSMRREGVRYARVDLRDNDMYFIPRKVVHQFRTTNACTSVAWHVRLKHYDDNNQQNAPLILSDPKCQNVRDHPGDQDFVE